MSAFPESGRSESLKTTELKGCLRPQADISETSGIHQSILIVRLYRPRSVNRGADGERHEQTKQTIPDIPVVRRDCQ